MSVKIMGAIWDLDLPHELAWVLMAYADHADHEGRNCYPGISLIAYKTGYSQRQVQRCTAELISRGILVVERPGGGRGKPTLYSIDLARAHRKTPDESPLENGDKMSPIPGNGDKMSPISSAPEPERVTPEPERVTSEPERVTKPCQKGDIAMSPEPLTVKLLTVIEPSEPTGFAEFRPKADAIINRHLRRDNIHPIWLLSPDGLLRCGLPFDLFVLANRASMEISPDVVRLAKQCLGRRVALSIVPEESCTSLPGSP